jgi:hypothetical protein
VLHLGDFVMFTFIMHELLNFKHFHYSKIKICRESWGVLGINGKPSMNINVLFNDFVNF